MEIKKKQTEIGKNISMVGKNQTPFPLLRVILKTKTEKAGIKNKVTSNQGDNSRGSTHSAKKGTKVKVKNTSLAF